MVHFGGDTSILDQTVCVFDYDVADSGQLYKHCRGQLVENEPGCSLFHFSFLIPVCSSLCL